jgi:hypothetical protein
MVRCFFKIGHECRNSYFNSADFFLLKKEKTKIFNFLKEKFEAHFEEFAGSKDFETNSLFIEK